MNVNEANNKLLLSSSSDLDSQQSVPIDKWAYQINKWAYDNTATEYAKNVQDLIPEEEIQEFVSYLPYKARILDIGCGSGRDARFFSSKGLSITGIDFCDNMLKIASKTAPLAQFHLMAIENMDFPPQCFDGIWANCSLLHIPKMKMPYVLNKIYSFLNRNGIFSLTIKEGEGEGLKKDIRYEKTPLKFWAYYKDSEIENLLTTAKFKIVSINRCQPRNYVADPLIHIFAIKLQSSL